MSLSPVGAVFVSGARWFIRRKSMPQRRFSVATGILVLQRYKHWTL